MMKIVREELFARLPAEWPHNLLPEICALGQASGRKLVVLDDDPTGTQTVYDVTVLTDWPVEALAEELREPDPLVYLLTNSRSLPQAEAQALNRLISRRLEQASSLSGRDFVLASRSDSTLRGHFPAEVDALADGLVEPVDGILIVPAFFEGGRYTVNDIHYVAEGEALVPAAETEYARDASFGYRSSGLREWVSEKSGGRIQPEEVVSLPLETLRSGGPEPVRQQLLKLAHRQVCIANAAGYRDLEVLALAALQAEAAGKRLIYRTAASFVRARAGLAPRGLLTAKDLAELVGPGPGLVVAGSYIEKSSRQIESLRALAGVAASEIPVEALLDSSLRPAVIEEAAASVDMALSAGQDALLYTSRRLVTGSAGEAALGIGQSVSAGLVEIVRRLERRPGWILAKGGITSSDIATGGLVVRRARVLGQALAGVPVWSTGPESRWPRLLYVVFPGNVGGPNSLADVVRLLRDAQEINR
jgi:uncharacterized protein YgbK (DUF1537 family)